MWVVRVGAQRPAHSRRLVRPGAVVVRLALALQALRGLLRFAVDACEPALGVRARRRKLDDVVRGTRLLGLLVAVPRIAHGATVGARRVAQPSAAGARCHNGESNGIRIDPAIVP
jgi:hypothetical protein